MGRPKNQSKMFSVAGWLRPALSDGRTRCRAEFPIRSSLFLDGSGNGKFQRLRISGSNVSGWDAIDAGGQ